MRIVLAFYALLKLCDVSGQVSKLDTSFIFFNVRMLLLTDGYEDSMRPRSEVQEFINGDWRYRYHAVPSEGYPSNYIFYSLTNQIMDGIMMSNTDTVPVRLNHAMNTKFLVAVNTTTKRMFKLDGFKCSGISEFMIDVSKYITSAKERRFIQRKKSFPANYIVHW